VLTKDPLGIGLLAEERLYFCEEKTNLNMNRLRDELAGCKKSCYAVDHGELQVRDECRQCPGIWC
jgi:hypothetical protein